MMLSKQNLEDVVKCESCRCKQCSMLHKSCNSSDIAQTALQLLNRVETAETILRDILSSGNVKSCEREIREFLEGVE